MVGKEEVLEQHKRHKGKIEVIGRVSVGTKEELSTYYTPGVAYACLAIKDNKDSVYDYTLKGRTAAIVTDGTRILGLGDIGPEAGLPVMEGKALLMKTFANIDAFPICVNTKDEDEFVNVVKNIAPSFGLINIEDIETPKVFSIVERLSKELDIPVFHDDRSGTAVVALAGLYNALKLAKKKLSSAKIVINGSGAAGVGIAQLLHYAGAKNIYIVDTAGLIYKGRENNMNPIKDKLAEISNKERFKGDLSSAAYGADVIIGASAKGAFGKDLIKSMSENPIVFALSNPEPEIEYQDALDAGAFVVATGRSDTPNQVNNVLAFPGIIRGVLEVRAKSIDDQMLIVAAKAIAKFAGRKLSREYIMPDPTDKNSMDKLTANVAAEIAGAAVRQDLARLNIKADEVKSNVKSSLKRYRKIEKIATRV